MSTADGKLNLVYGATEINVDLPVFPYRTKIELPFDIQKLDSGKYGVYDHGATYDVRSCECEVELTSTDYNNLLAIILNAAQGRGANLTMSMYTGSGFFPFGPDKGDTGPFTVTAEILDRKGIGSAPWLYFKATLRFVNVGAWPAYSLPDQVNEGTMSIGLSTDEDPDQLNTVYFLRFPPQWFAPRMRAGVHVAIEQNATSQWMDKGAGAGSDAWETTAGMVCNESKAAAAIYFLTGTARSGSWVLNTGANAWPFDRDKAQNGNFTVQMIQDSIEITHTVYNRFEFDLHFGYAA